MLKPVYQKIGRNGEPLNLIFVGEADIYFAMGRPRTYRDMKTGEMRTEVKPRAYAIDIFSRPNKDGKLACVWEHLAEFIEEVGPFYFMTTIAPVAQKEGKYYRLERVLYSIENRIDYDEAEAIGVEIAQKRPMGQLPCLTPDEAELFERYDVYNLWSSNLRSDVRPVISSDSATITHDVDGSIIIGTRKTPKVYYTDYADGLCDILRRVTSWHIREGGSLKANVGKGASFASIICAYRMGLIPKGTTDIKGAFSSVSAYFADHKIDVDHLVENPCNNYLWALSPIYLGVNRNLKSRRTKIRAPYFFLSANDWDNGRVIVKCGVAGYGWERCFVFGDLTDKDEAELYLRCFCEFEAKAREAKHVMHSSSDRSLLRYWGHVISYEERKLGRDNWKFYRAIADNNPLTALTREKPPFDRYSTGAFETIPILKV